MRILQDGVERSQLSEPLKTNILTSLDLISYKGLQVVRIRIPRQTQPTFLGEECYLRIGSSTKKATGPQIAAASKLFFAEVAALGGTSENDPLSS
jgi:predicted HTH transcriptional regulator